MTEQTASEVQVAPSGQSVQNANGKGTLLYDCMLMIVYAILLGLYVEAVKAVFLPLLAIYFAALKERPFRMFFMTTCSGLLGILLLSLRIPFIDRILPSPIKKALQVDQYILPRGTFAEARRFYARLDPTTQATINEFINYPAFDERMRVVFVKNADTEQREVASDADQPDDVENMCRYICHARDNKPLLIHIPGETFDEISFAEKFGHIVCLRNIVVLISIGNDSPRLRSIAFDPIVRGELGYLRKLCYRNVLLVFAISGTGSNVYRLKREWRYYTATAFQIVKNPPQVTENAAPVIEKVTVN